MEDSDNEEMHEYEQLEERTTNPLSALPTFFTILLGDVKVLKERLTTGLNPNLADGGGSTLIHNCSLIGSLQTLETLLRYTRFPLNWDCKNWRGETPLFVAIKNHRPLANLKLIVDQCSDIVNIGNTENVTPLHKAVKLPTAEVTEYLIKKGADLHAIDFDGCTPLHDAIIDNNWENVYCLLAYGPDMSIRESRCDMTPLELALKQKCDIEHVQNLLLHTHETDIKLVTWISVVEYGSYELFTVFWENILNSENDSYSSSSGFFIKFLKGCKFDNKLWLQCFYELIESEYGVYCIQNYKHILVDIFISIYDRKLEKNEIIKLLFTILSYSPGFSFMEIKILHKLFGYGDVFEVLFDCSPPFTNVFLCSELDVQRSCLVFKGSHICSHNALQYLMQSNCITRPYERCPKLIEIARNTIYFRIKNCFEKEPFDYLKALKTFCLPRNLYSFMLFDEDA